MDVDDKKKKKDDNDEEEEEESSSEDEGAPPRREQPQAQTFGDDPSTFPDPTVYEIRDVHPGMSEEEKKEIFSVASYPRTTLPTSSLAIHRTRTSAVRSPRVRSISAPSQPTSSPTSARSRKRT